MKFVEMVLAEDWAIYILGVVIATLIMVVFFWLNRTSRPHDEGAQRYFGIVGFFLYRCFCSKRKTSEEDKEKEGAEK